jgi:hypothetical protein
MKHAGSQVSEPRTNSQYHPQHVPGLGEPPKLWLSPNRHAYSGRPDHCSELTVCQSRLFITIPSLSIRYVMTAVHNKANQLACREF